MSLELWLAFVAASAICLSAPGRVLMLIVSYALGQGRKSMLATVPAAALGTAVVMTAVLLVLGWLQTVAPEILDPVRWLGAAYLAFVVIRAWRLPGGHVRFADNDNLREEKPLRIMGHMLAETALNRHSYAFFVALLTHFLQPTPPLLDQAEALIATFLGLAAVVWLAAAIGAEPLHRLVRMHYRKRSRGRRNRNVLIASSTVTAGYRKIAA